MRISIDTKEDSHEEIRKVIKMLQHLVGDSGISNQGNIFGESSSVSSTSDANAGLSAFGAMFGDSAAPIADSGGGGKLIDDPDEDDKKQKEPRSEDSDELSDEIIPY